MSETVWDAEHAHSYDAHFDLVADRQRYRLYLTDLLRCLPDEPVRFLELGCGTGFFTEALFEVLPGIQGTAIDGSDAMLDKAKERFRDAGHEITFRCELLQELDWPALGTFPLVFSSLVVHHLADDEKRTLLENVFDALEPGGAFVLIDSFRPTDPVADGIIEKLTILDIQRRVEAQRGTAASPDKIITHDREHKAAEGDQETSLETCLGWLREARFRSVTSIFQDVRIACVLAIKPDEP